MVLTQQVSLYHFDGENITFPYHYGSYATLIPASRSSRLNVSIPLWFLRNQLHYTLIENENSFPYHNGSYATEDDDCCEYFEMAEFPLWFLRNLHREGR